MNRAVVFGRRNIAEMLRSPVTWIFGLAMPLGIFVIMQIVMASIGDAAASVPMFGVSRFTCGALIFAMSFSSMTVALAVSGDVGKSFLARLSVSPMTSAEFILGYVLGALPLTAGQIVVTFCAALCFGLTPTWNIVPAMLLSAVTATLFVAIGLVFGSLLSQKSAPPVCSAAVQVAAVLSGMWFDLDMIGGGFSTFCHVLPFAQAYDMVRYTLAGDWANVWLPFVVTAAYAAVICVFAVLAFGHRRRHI